MLRAKKTQQEACGTEFLRDVLRLRQDLIAKADVLVPLGVENIEGIVFGQLAAADLVHLRGLGSDHGRPSLVLLSPLLETGFFRRGDHRLIGEHTSIAQIAVEPGRSHHPEDGCGRSQPAKPPVHSATEQPDDPAGDESDRDDEENVGPPAGGGHQAETEGAYDDAQHGADEGEREALLPAELLVAALRALPVLLHELLCPALLLFGLAEAFEALLGIRLRGLLRLGKHSQQQFDAADGDHVVVMHEGGGHRGSVDEQRACWVQFHQFQAGGDRAQFAVPGSHAGLADQGHVALRVRAKHRGAVGQVTVMPGAGEEAGWHVGKIRVRSSLLNFILVFIFGIKCHPSPPVSRHRCAACLRGA